MGVVAAYLQKKKRQREEQSCFIHGLSTCKHRLKPEPHIHSAKVYPLQVQVTLEVSRATAARLLNSTTSRAGQLVRLNSHWDRNQVHAPFKGGGNLPRTNMFLTAPEKKQGWWKRGGRGSEHQPTWIRRTCIRTGLHTQQISAFMQGQAIVFWECWDEKKLHRRQQVKGVKISIRNDHQTSQENLRRVAGQHEDITRLSTHGDAIDQSQTSQANNTTLRYEQQHKEECNDQAGVVFS